MCRLLRITRDCSEVFLVEDALMQKGDVNLALNILEKTSPASIPKIMDHIAELATCVVAPVNQPLLDFLRENRKDLSPSALLQYQLLQKPTVVDRKAQQAENLLNHMAQKVICDPTSTTIFEVCEFIRTEAENLTKMQAESQQAEKEQSTEKTVSLKNATMKLQQGNASQECVLPKALLRY